VLGIDAQDYVDRAVALMRARHITFVSLRDPGGEYARRFGASMYPETFLIDRRGRIAALRRGPVDRRWLDEHLRWLLAESA
jgi:cytochrome c biogenesis protein CcmG, thiol:disulfide interchange protein DsbE